MPPRLIATELRRRGIWLRVDGLSWASGAGGTTHKSPAWKRMHQLEQSMRAITGDGVRGNRAEPPGTTEPSGRVTPGSAPPGPKATE